MFCCGKNPWCVIDTLLHKIKLVNDWICDKHDAVITGEYL